jgi:rhodanese-related sulfurtransferase
MSKALLAAFAALALASGCKSAPTASKDTEKKVAAPSGVRELSVADVATALKDGTATVVDANDVETRRKYGMVPGAVLLTNNKTYALSELPSAKDEPLIFYCGGMQCRASDAAASRAATAGYGNVAVMRAGIRGWLGAGQPTNTLPKI